MNIRTNGDWQTAKVAAPIIVALNIQAVSEALLFASKNGADPAKVREALMGGFASSQILEVYASASILESRPTLLWSSSTDCERDSARSNSGSRLASRSSIKI